jgi:hypothetical protein
MTAPNKTLPDYLTDFTEVFTDWFFNPPTCELFEAFLHNEYRDGTYDCLSNQEWGYLCGCSGFHETMNYRRSLLLWLPRISSILSIFVSSVEVALSLRRKSFSHVITQFFDRARRSSFTTL